MHKVTILQKLGIISLYNIIVITGAHGLFGDALLFQSDTYSLVLYLTAMVFTGLICTFLFTLPFALLKKQWRVHIYDKSVILLIILVITTFLILLCFLGKSFNNSTFTLIVNSYTHLFTLTIIPACLIIYLLRKYLDEIRNRIEKLGKFIFIVLLIFVPVAIAFNHFTKPCLFTECEDGNHLVLIVLDGMPTQYLRSYNPHAAPTAFDKIFANGYLFNNMRTTAVFTNAYFGILYDGKVKKSKNNTSGPTENLISKLQEDGIYTQFLSYHRNSIPEASYAHTNHYKGLRSYFLTTNTVWIPEWLGLKYHITIPHWKFNYRRIKSKPGRFVYKYLNTDSNGKYLRHDVNTFVKHIKHNKRNSPHSFTLIHVDLFDFVGNDKRIQRLFSAQKAGMETVKASDFNYFKGKDSRYVREPDYVSRFRDDNNRYSQEYDALVQTMNEKARANMKIVADQFSAFMEGLNKELENDEKPPTIILTADHGRIYGKSRLWYGYHPNEEVVKVPFVIFNTERMGIDTRLFETPDLTASILDFFGVPGIGDSDSISVFDENQGRNYAVSITMFANRQKEFFLVIYSKEGDKYLINMHPEGDGNVLQFSLGDDYQEKLVCELKEIPEHIKELITESITRFNLDKHKLHPVINPK